MQKINKTRYFDYLKLLVVFFILFRVEKNAYRTVAIKAINKRFSFELNIVYSDPVTNVLFQIFETDERIPSETTK